MKEFFVSTRARRWFTVASVTSLVVLSACSTAPEVITPAAPPSFQSLMDSADAAQKQNQAAQAMSLFEQAAKADPANKQPWLRMAQAYFDSRAYGQAITASQEALHRDNTDITAKSLMAASGLRVSADALEQLRQANAVGGSTKTEAQALARIMREAVGEAVFPVPKAVPAVVDAPAAKPAPVRRRPAAAPAVKPATAAPVAASPAPATAAPAPAAKPAAALAPAPAKPSNPFDILKK